MDWVRDGMSASSALGHGEHQAVLLDLGLPERDGLEVLQRLRSQGNRIAGGARAQGRPRQCRILYHHHSPARGPPPPLVGPGPARVLPYAACRWRASTVLQGGRATLVAQPTEVRKGIGLTAAEHTLAPLLLLPLLIAWMTAFRGAGRGHFGAER